VLTEEMQSHGLLEKERCLAPRKRPDDLEGFVCTTTPRSQR